MVYVWHAKCFTSDDDFTQSTDDIIKHTSPPGSLHIACNFVEHFVVEIIAVLRGYTCDRDFVC